MTAVFPVSSFDLLGLVFEYLFEDVRKLEHDIVFGSAKVHYVSLLVLLLLSVFCGIITYNLDAFLVLATRLR
jgi:hypothetical protein